MNRAESFKLACNLSSERSNRASGEHLNEGHHVLLELFQVVLYGSTDDARVVVVLVSVDIKFSSFPVFIDFAKSLLLFHLLDGRIRDILNILLDGEQVSIKKFLEFEGVGFPRHLFAGQLNKLRPMALFDGMISEHLNEGEDSLHIFKLLDKLLVGRVLFGIRWKSLTIRQESGNTVLHVLDLLSDLGPLSFLPLRDGLGNLKVKSVEFVKLVELILSLDKSGVALMRESKELLTRMVRFVFTVVHRELLLEVLKLVKGLTGGEISLHGAVLLKVITEDFNFNDKGLNVTDQLLFEVGLVIMKSITDSESLGNKFVPFLLEILSLVEFISIHFERVLNKSVHVTHRFELEVDVGLLLADFLKGEHDTAERVNILDIFVDLQTDLFDIVSQVGKKVLSLLVDILGEDHFPLKNVCGESFLNTHSLEGKGTNLMGRLNLFNLIVFAVEISEFLLKVLELGLFFTETLEVILRFLGP